MPGGAPPTGRDQPARPSSRSRATGRGPARRACTLADRTFAHRAWPRAAGRSARGEVGEQRLGRQRAAEQVARGPPATVAPGAKSRSATNPYQPGSPSHHGPRCADGRPDGRRDDRRQGVVREVAGRLDELAADGPPRPLRVGDRRRGRRGRSRTRRRSGAGPAGDGRRSRTAPSTTSSITAAVPVEERVARRPRRRPASAAARPARHVPAQDVGGRLEERGRSPSGTRRRPGRTRDAAAASACPLSWRSSWRLPTPPSAYVAKTQVGRGASRPRPDRAPARAGRERDRDERPAGPRQDVVAEAERRRVRAEAAQVGVVDRRAGGPAATRASSRRSPRRPRSGSPTAPARPGR